MAIITISRQEGSLGDEIARSVSNKLNYNLIDKHTIHDMAAAYKGRYDSEMNVLANESKPGFFDFLFHQRSVYGHLIASMMYEAAGRDNCVMVGRGGQFLLRDKPHVIHVRFVAPFDFRVQRIMDTLHLERKIAQEYIRTSDQTRDEFIHYLFREKVDDSRYYHLMLDTGSFPQDRVEDFLVRELMRIEAEHPMTDRDKDIYVRQSIEKRVEIVLMKEMKESNYIKVTAVGGGHIVLSGYLSTEAENKAAVKHVREVEGVTSIENKIIVSPFPVKPWY